METKKCTKCKRELPLTEFYSRGNGKYRSECKECHKSYVKGKYQERKQAINDIKQECKCQKCGESRHYVLDFHHIDPSQKDFTISRMSANRNDMEDIKKEIEKCVVLCANCHREFHYLNEHNNRTLEEYLS